MANFSLRGSRGPRTDSTQVRKRPPHMPIGEIAALAAALIFSLTAVLDKLMTRRFKPIPLSALAASGGGICAIVTMFITGEASRLPDTPMAYLALAVAGSVMALCIGMPLYFRFLESVDVSKVTPISSGLQTLLAVLIGLALLGEESSALKLVGIAGIVVGIYALSFSQRRQVAASQASWLGLKGMLFMLFVVGLFVGGTALQTIAVNEIGSVIANGVRLAPVVLMLSAMATYNLDFLLGSDTRAHTPSPRSLAAQRRRRAARKPGPITHLFRVPRLLHVPYWARRRAPRQAAMRRLPVRFHPPVYWTQIDGLAKRIADLGGALTQVEGRGGRGGLRYRLHLPGTYAPEATLTAMPEVASARWTGQWAAMQQVEIRLHPPDSELDIGLGPSRGGEGAIMGRARIRYVNLGRRNFLPILFPVFSGALSMGIASLLMLVALDRVGLAVTSVLMSTQLLWITFMSSLFLRERLGWKTFLGVGATAAGVVLVVL